MEVGSATRFVAEENVNGRALPRHRAQPRRARWSMYTQASVVTSDVAVRVGDLVTSRASASTVRQRDRVFSRFMRWPCWTAGFPEAGQGRVPTGQRDEPRFLIRLRRSGHGLRSMAVSMRWSARMSRLGIGTTTESAVVAGALTPVSARRPSKGAERARLPAAAAGPTGPERCPPARAVRRPAAADAASARAASRRTARRRALRSAR